MKRALLLLAALGPLASTNAYVEVFFTSAADGYGLTNPALAFAVTGGDGYDGYNYLLADKDGSGGLSLGDLPPVEPVATADPGETIYVWLKFVGEPNGRKIIGLSFKCNEVIPDAMAFYKLDSSNIGSGMRWESTLAQLNGTIPPDPNNPFAGPGKVYMIAVSSNGIVNAPSAAVPQPLYYGEGTAAAGTRVALLGAIRLTEPGDYTFGFADPPPIFIVEPDGWPQPTVNFGAVHVTPEPASMLLLGLAGLLLRRR